MRGGTPFVGEAGDVRLKGWGTLSVGGVRSDTYPLPCVVCMCSSSCAHQFKDDIVTHLYQYDVSIRATRCVIVRANGGSGLG